MKATPLLREVLVVLVAALATACERKTDCSTCDHENRMHAVRPAAVAPPITRLEPWQTFNEGFNGCAGGCGLRSAGPMEGAVAQPGAIIGQATYCPVSGVVFQIKPTSAQRQVGDKVFYFCCESCAEYFMANHASILAARGITS